MVIVQERLLTLFFLPNDFLKPCTFVLGIVVIQFNTSAPAKMAPSTDPAPALELHNSTFHIVSLPLHSIVFFSALSSLICSHINYHLHVKPFSLNTLFFYKNTVIMLKLIPRMMSVLSFAVMLTVKTCKMYANKNDSRDTSYHAFPIPEEFLMHLCILS